MRIPFLDLKRQFTELDAELTAAATRVLSSGTYILGSEVESFETEWAQFCGASSAASVASGTDALTLALIASGRVRRNKGDEVITSTLTSPYTALSILKAGAVPIFVDIKRGDYLLDPGGIEKAITPRTRAIVPVHLYGRLADMEAICEIAARRNLVVIDDASHAHGAQAARGRHPSLASAYSLYPTKNLGACGDGGVVTANDSSLIDKVKLLRQGGHEPALASGQEGLNSRLDELQAAILRVKLKRLKAWNERRTQLARTYLTGLQASQHIRLPQVSETEQHAHHLFVIEHDERDRLRSHLHVRGVETLVHYPSLLHQQPLFKSASQRPLPVAEHAVRHILSLPLYPQLRDEELRHVVESVLDFDHTLA